MQARTDDRETETERERECVQGGTERRRDRIQTVSVGQSGFYDIMYTYKSGKSEIFEKLETALPGFQIGFVLWAVFWS